MIDLAYEVGETVFLSYMRMPGTVRQVVSYDNSLYGYIVEAYEGHGTDLFRMDEVEDYDADLWE